ncbi:MAG: hypothetical protein ACKOPE_03025 [Novosphingobium sp.]
MDRRRQINELCTKLGMIMEDSAPIALLIRNQPDADFDGELRELINAVHQQWALVEAIETLRRQS